MNGVLIIDKPADITSHDVVARVRRILKTRRVGHTGTLDPFATGVMVLLIGSATRLAQFLDRDEKEYEAVVRLGYETETGDETGARRDAATSKRERHPTASDVEKVLEAFRGRILQTPPMYSAKKVAGRKLYEHARKGETIDRPAVPVTIHRLELADRSLAPVPDENTWEFRLTVVCSAGTYIRALAEDIGRELGVGAHLAGLRRTRAGKFGIDGASTLDELEHVADTSTVLIPVEQAVSHLSKLHLADDRIAKTRSGLSTRVLDGRFKTGEPVRMLDALDQLVAVGFYDDAETSVKPKVVLI